VIAVRTDTSRGVANPYQKTQSSPERITSRRTTPAVTHRDDQPAARDPFGESFEDEEVVFEAFPVLGDALGTRTPRVAERTAGERMSVAVDRVLSVAAHQIEALVEEEEAFDLSVSEMPLPLDAVPLVKVVNDLPVAAEGYCDPVYPEDELSLVQEVTELATGAATIRYPTLEMEQESGVLSITSVRGKNDQAVEDVDAQEVADEDDILIVEDSPTDTALASAGVHRQDYRQLFANLRRK
jgi:hypothetical protein